MRYVVAERAHLDSRDLLAIRELDEPLRRVLVRDPQVLSVCKAALDGGKDLVRRSLQHHGRGVVTCAVVALRLRHLLDAADCVTRDHDPLGLGDARGKRCREGERCDGQAKRQCSHHRLLVESCAGQIVFARPVR
jgi:hypothetical protein